MIINRKVKVFSFQRYRHYFNQYRLTYCSTKNAITTTLLIVRETQWQTNLRGANMRTPPPAEYSEHTSSRSAEMQSAGSGGRVATKQPNPQTRQKNMKKYHLKMFFGGFYFFLERFFNHIVEFNEPCLYYIVDKFKNLKKNREVE